jgi:hypothetical protein
MKEMSVSRIGTLLQAFFLGFLGFQAAVCGCDSDVSALSYAISEAHGQG